MGEIDSQKFNEAKVREEIIAPLLRRLGYGGDSPHTITYEQYLSYPKEFLGRKKPKTDPVLAGRVDYTLEVSGGEVRWVLEAKASDVEIDSGAVEQAWSYANHAEVRAVYTVLCNGRSLQVYQTNRGPLEPPILTISRDAFDSDYQRIEGVLGPDAILRDHPKIHVDAGRPLAKGFKSWARVTNGIIRYAKNDLDLRPLEGMQFSIVGGAFGRDSSGYLLAVMHTQALNLDLQLMNEKLGLDHFVMVGLETDLSADPENPSQFVYENAISIAAGEQMFNIGSWEWGQLPESVEVATRAVAVGALKGQRFEGEFQTRMRSSIGIEVNAVGTFFVQLA